MSQNIGGMAPYMNMGGPRGQSPMYYPPCPGGPMETPHHPHMVVRPPPFFHDDKINHCGNAAVMSQPHMRFRMGGGGGMGEFKPPMVGVVEPPPVPPPAPPPTKKKRRANNSNVNNSAVNHHPQPPPPSIQDLAPPPPSGYGDTIVASNPFDDSPPAHTMMVRHMGCGGVVSGGNMMGGHCGMGSPMGGGRSPMGGPMLCSTPPMHRASPLVAADCMAPRKGSPMMGPGPSCVSPIHSPNGPMTNGPPDPTGACNGPPRGPPPPGPPPHPMHPVHPVHPVHHPMHHPPAPPHQPPYHHHPPTKPMPVSAGKVYPVDQPMVFNPQNPNAPPIYPCGVCHKEVHDNDQAMLCESGCNFWFHRICTGLTEGAYHLLTAEVYAEWACDKCLNTKNIPLVKLKP